MLAWLRRDSWLDQALQLGLRCPEPFFTEDRLLTSIKMEETND